MVLWITRQFLLLNGLSDESIQAQQDGILGIGFLIEGFVVLYSKVNLDVAAVYTGCGFNVPMGLTAAQLLFSPCVDPSLQVDELIPFSPVPAPEAFIRLLSVSSAGLSLSVQPFSPVGYDGAQLLIYNQNGQLLHESSFTAGTQLGWQPLASDGRALANGVYFYRVGVRDVLGNVSYKTGKFALVR